MPDALDPLDVLDFAVTDPRPHAWRWVGLRDEVRSSGGWLLGFGLLTGLAALVPPVDPSLLWVGGVGSLLIVSGLWQVAAPSAKGLITGGLCLLVVGLVNLVSVAADYRAGRPVGWFWVVLGLFQLQWARRLFGRYSSARTLDDGQAPDPELQAWVRAARKRIRFGAIGRHPDLVACGWKPAGRLRSYRLALAERELLAVDVVGDELTAVPREQVELRVSVEPSRVVLAQAELRLGERRGGAHLDAVALVRLRDWLAPGEPTL